MRVAVFALAAVSVLTGASAYADRITVPAQPEEVVTAPATSPVEEPASAGVPSAHFLDVSSPRPTGPATPAAVTADPSGVVLMATGLMGVGGMLWRRRSLIR